ncbi:MAG: GGDEF domain-containing protein [Phycisphaerae bacterium]
MVEPEQKSAGTWLVEYAPQSLGDYIDRFSSLLVVLFETDGRIIGCNDRFRDLLETRDCPYGQPLADFVEYEDLADLLPGRDESCRQVRLSVTGGGMAHLFKAIIVCTPHGCAAIGQTPHLTDHNAIAEMSSVNNDLSNITRELHRKNRELQHAKEEIETLARTDGLTGLLNRQYFMAELDRAVSAARRHGRELSVVMADLDHFKNINDTFGHQAGDAVLRRFARLLAENSRKEDTLCRYGGEEFICATPDTDRESAAAFAERVRRALADSHIPRIEARITASFGVASLREHDTLHSLIKRADEALYAAKDAGRNRVNVAGPRAAVG